MYLSFIERQLKKGSVIEVRQKLESKQDFFFGGGSVFFVCFICLFLWGFLLVLFVCVGYVFCWLVRVFIVVFFPFMKVNG